MFKAVVKTIAFLAILFVMLYVGIHNRHEIDFFFPIAGTTAKTPFHAYAGIIYFFIFAAGVLAGTIITVGTGRGAGKKSGGAKDR